MQDRLRASFLGLGVVAALLMMVRGGSLCAEDSGAKQVFRAGAAAVDITPELGELIVGGWAPMPAERVHDPLHVRCVVLDDGRTRLALAICDNLGISRSVFDEAKRRVHESWGIPPGQQIMAATHTHSSVTGHFPNRYVPDQPLTKYQKRLIAAIVKAMGQAMENLQPARIGWSTVDVPEHVFNRRWFMKPGTPTPNPYGGTDRAVMNPGRGNPNLDKPAGPIDPEVSFFSVRSLNGMPIALLANYSLHYVGGGIKGELSADYFAMFAGRVGELLGAEGSEPPFVGVMTNGTSGDINNINFGVKAERKPPYEQMRYVADDVARRVGQAEAEMDYRDWVPLAGVDTELVLKTRTPTAEQIARARLVASGDEEVELYHKRETTYGARVLAMTEMPPTRTIVLTAFRIGDLGIVTIPFEVFAEIGLELKEKSPLGTTFVISHAGGSTGYLPTPRQHGWGGYETWLGTNFVQKDASVKIVESLLEMLDELAAQ